MGVLNTLEAQLQAIEQDIVDAKRYIECLEKAIFENPQMCESKHDSYMRVLTSQRKILAQLYFDKSRKTDTLTDVAVLNLISETNKEFVK